MRVGAEEGVAEVVSERLGEAGWGDGGGKGGRDVRQGLDGVCTFSYSIRKDYSVLCSELI